MPDPDITEQEMGSTPLNLSQSVMQSLAVSADFYGVTMDEALRRHRVIEAHTGDPRDPICIGCARRPHEIPGYVMACMEEEGTHDGPVMQSLAAPDSEVRSYVINNEGTYNPLNGHILCDICYIKNGSPSSPSGWRCP